MNNTPPASWPPHLLPFQPSPHSRRTFRGVEFVPYDWTRTRVKSFAAFRSDGIFAGLVARTGNQYQSYPHGGERSVFAGTLDEIARTLGGVQEPR